MIAEKALKAIIADKTNEVPPKPHELEKLTVLSEIYDNLTEEQLTFLEKLIPLQIEAQYFEYGEEVEKIFTAAYSTQLLDETEGFFCWIKSQLEN